MPARHDWSGQRLAQLLAVVGSYQDEEAALRGAAEFAAIAVEAEIAAVVRDGELSACIGFRRGREPVEALLQAAHDAPMQVELPLIGRCALIVEQVGHDPDTRMLIARTGAAFAPEERSLLAGLARVLGLAIRPLRALEVERSLRVQLQDREGFLRSISEIERAIAQRRPQQEVFDLIAAGAAEVLGQEVALLRLLDEEDPGYLTIVASVGRDPRRQAPLLRRRVDRAVGGRAILDGRLIIADDYPSSPHREPAVVADGIASAMAAPVHRDGRVAGSLVVASATPTVYSAAQQEVLTSFAGHVSLALNDATAQEAMRRAYGEAVHRATHDALTGLPNRGMVVDRLDLTLARRGGGTVTVVFVDLDRFKAVNDSYGHATGDQVLMTVADRLRAAARPGDTVARLAGDEFLVTCEDLGGLDAVRLAERLVERVSEPMELDDREVVISASAGVAVADGSRAAEEVLRDADTAMYRAKQRGRARVEVFDDVMRTTVLKRLEVEQGLRRALRDDQLRIHYQPIVRTGDGRPVGVEALVRWDRPGAGLVAPGTFIPVAEEAGLIIPIGRWVLRNACRALAGWRRAHPDLADLRLNVNLSARQFNDPGLVETVTEALAAADLPPEALALEITESVLMDDVDATGATLATLRDLGVRLVIDDFGTGYSSLSYLKRFPVSELKVDRSFVDGLGRDAEDDAIVRAIVGLAHALDLDVVGEGVETPQQLRLLGLLGCAAAQGFLIGRPVPDDQTLAALLAGASLSSGAVAAP